MQIGKAFDYIIKGAQFLGAIGTLYGLYDAPRKQREETRAMEDRIDKEVNRIIRDKVDDYVKARVNAELEGSLKDHIHNEVVQQVDVAMNLKMKEIDSNVEAIIAAHEMRKGKNGQSSK